MPTPEIVGPLTVLSASGAFAAKKVFGPSLDSIGQALGRLTDYRVRNIGRVVENAAAKLPPEEKEGFVPARVAIRMLEEGSYADEPIVVEYLGGVLASSWSPRGRDDRGTGMTALVSRMSSYALRGHFIFYSEIRRLLLGRSINLGTSDETRQAQIFVPLRVFESAMGYGDDENRAALLTHVLHTLDREGLIFEWGSGSADFLTRWVPGVTEPGIHLEPRMAGVELFMWGMGQGAVNPHSFLDPSIPVVTHSIDISIQSGSFIVGDQAAGS
jgi:hypothetical protein